MCSLIFYREVAVVLLTICLIYQTKMQIIITYVLRILCKARKTNALLKRKFHSTEFLTLSLSHIAMFVVLRVKLSDFSLS